MYSLVHGAIFQLFGNGEFGNYYIATNIFFLLVIILIVALLRLNLNNTYTLLISCVFFVMQYNRLAFLLPVMLLLITPKLIRIRGLWLFTWFITSLFSVARSKTTDFQSVSFQQEFLINSPRGERIWNIRLVDIQNLTLSITLSG